MHAWVISSTLDLKIRCHDRVSVKVCIVSVKNEKGDYIRYCGCIMFQTDLYGIGNTIEITFIAQLRIPSSAGKFVQMFQNSSTNA